MVLSQPDRADALLFCLHHLAEGLIEGLRLGHAALDMKVDENPEIHMFLTGAYPSGKALACHIRMANT